MNDIQEYHAFIAHASADKDEVARPLAEALREMGLSVWYDEFELRIGDNLRRKIDAGIANSKFGIIILSEHFFAGRWPQYELDGIVSRHGTDNQRILPIRHRISKEYIATQSPSLADIVARTTSNTNIKNIAAEITEVIMSRE